MNKKPIRLTESQLRSIVMKTVSKILSESYPSFYYQVIDDATEEVIENNSDFEDAVKTAKANSRHGERFLVVNSATDEVLFDTNPNTSYKF